MEKTWGPQGCGDHMGTMLGQHGDHMDVETTWAQHEDNVETTWGPWGCGDHMGTMWGQHGDNMGTT